MKAFSLLLAIQQWQDEFITMQAPWEPSDELIANIRNYTMGMLLSSWLATYKGVVPNNYVAGILKRYRFDLPADIERNHGCWSKVIKAIQNEMTEQRAKIKKTLRAGTDSDDHQEHLNIFKLTVELCEGTSCEPSVQLCARVALLRKTFLTNSNRDFWDAANKNLAEICNVAGSNPKKMTKIFSKILANDRATHGVTEEGEDSDIQEQVPEWQQAVDEFVGGQV
ncbi:uncharacterized protein PHACADRAFT_202258 [Phanerochaete carnosa HHB-10118-sp]|uniref:Uncharacterized protein n=1 Tax=Phanerochaete carnosa (strain HHB-10118-sp) TaxID=650164 RepID=K5VCT9_PHACS|nr:uncharacterized protein PHACADRAFT_202258 [Phanerochaete carnosa HHB-10118-sp]EKM48903.1 hypothetical protein PHACADRAFT_202258 [Phanerochaete carnosa HHB-10118-sp]